jgi:ribosomal protein L15
MHGFNRNPGLRTVYVTCNVSDLEGLAKGQDTVDLTAMGIDKLLGSGRINSALKITVEEWSARAAEKVSAAGGSFEGEGEGEWEEE